MTSRLSRRLGALVATVALALVGTMLVQPPANAAARDWQTIYKTVRSLKAQACRTGTFESPQGYKVKALRWRGNAVQAKLGGSVQLFTDSDRLEDWYSDWKRMSAGKVSSVTTTYFLASEQVRIKMRVKSRNGTTVWSRSYRFIDIEHC